VIEVQQQVLPPAGPDGVIPITILVTNRGEVEVDNLTVSQALPPRHELVEAAPLPERLRSTLFWPVGRLAPGQRRVVRLRLKGPGGPDQSELHNSVSVSFRTTARNTSGAAEPSRPDLKLTVENPESATVGELASFQLVISNRGARAAQAVVVHTRLPASLSHPLGLDLENEVGSLAAGQTRTIPLHVTPTRPGEVHGRVRVEAQGQGAVEREFTLRVEEDRLGLSVSGPTLCAGGWPCPYGFTVANEGTEAVRPARLVAYLPEGLSFVKGSDNARYDADTHSVLWDLGEVGPGRKKTVLVDGVVRQPGAQQCQVVLTAGQNRLKRVTWTTKVLAPEAQVP
jgi:uncharacterized repeat protein (TIGR01451 family)